MQRWLLCILCLALLTVKVPEAAAQTSLRQLRVIAYDYKQSAGPCPPGCHPLAAAESYSAYWKDLDRQVSAASIYFSDSPPTLALLPEDTGLTAWIVGERGRNARQAAENREGVGEILKQVLVPYLLQILYYRVKCPTSPLSRNVLLALTDTTWRAFGEGLSRVAAQHRIWVMANLNAPTITVTRNRLDVWFLADPEQRSRGYAYKAGCEIWNTAFLFNPGAGLDRDGAADPKTVVSATRKKVYLVEDERSQSLSGLGMSSESPANARVIEFPLAPPSGRGMPLARLGVLTSKDAWSSDIVERLEIDGMDVFLQPEAGAWAGTGAPPPDVPSPQPPRARCTMDPADNRLAVWNPDVMTRAIWSMVQWQAETVWGVLSNLTGNLGDHYFDGTATITRDAHSEDRADKYLLGRLRQPGIVRRADWVFLDPPKGVPFDDLKDRRAILDAKGACLQPGSGSPLENAQHEDYVVKTIDLPPLGPAVREHLRAGPQSVRIAPGQAAQWEPTLASGPQGEIYAAWTDLRAGFESPYVARSADGGVSWSDPVHAGDSTFRQYDQQANQYRARLAVAGGTLHLVWADFRCQSWDIYAAHSLVDWKTWPRPGSQTGCERSSSMRVDHAGRSGENYPNENHHQEPVVAALGNGTLVAAWSDARGTKTEQNIMVARLPSEKDAAWQGDVPADGSGPRGTDQWSPAIATSGNQTVTVAWQDIRAAAAGPTSAGSQIGWNQIFVSRSNDGGRSFNDAVRVAPSPVQQWQPALAFAPDGRVAVAWSEGSGGGERRIKIKIFREGRATGEALAIDRSAPPGARQARPAITFAGGTFWVAWQDDRAGDWDVLLAPLDNVGNYAARVPIRVDDGPDGTQARLPAIAVAGSRLVIAWEDTRACEDAPACEARRLGGEPINGNEQIRMTVLSPRGP